MTRECFILLSIMADSKYGLSDKDRDVQRFIEKTSGDSKFKDMLKLIMGGGSSTKKVDNFLQETEDAAMGAPQAPQLTAMHDYQVDPELYKTAKEIYETPGYDPSSKAEAKRQLDLMDAGLPRFPKV